jgi:hypothetical protein
MRSPLFAYAPHPDWHPSPERTDFDRLMADDAQWAAGYTNGLEDAARARRGARPLGPNDALERPMPMTEQLLGGYELGVADGARSLE